MGGLTLAVNSRELAGSLTAVKGGKVFRPETAGNFKEAVFRLGLFLAKIWGWALNYAFFGRDDYVIPNLVLPPWYSEAPICMELPWQSCDL